MVLAAVSYRTPIAPKPKGRAIDVGRMNKSFFINVASMGFGAEITATTPVELKKKLGGGAYTLMGMVKAMNLTPYTGRLLIPGQEPIEGNMLFGAVGNNHFAGGGFDIAPNAQLDDDQELHCNLDGEPVSKKKLWFRVLPHHLRVAF